MATPKKKSSSNTLNQSLLKQSCVLNYLLERISLRWKMEILFSIWHGATHFNQLKQQYPSLSDQVLGARLKELEQEGLISKNISADKGRSPIWYQPSSKAGPLLVIMQELCLWEMEWNGVS
jgi:DNA-binding HxlR family transcriptional regulator